MNYSIIIPCFNSEKYIIKNLDLLINYLKKIKAKYEIIVVDDCSLDKTFKLLNKFKKKITIIKNKENIGKSYSLINGVLQSKYKNIVLIDSDLPYFEKLKTIMNNLKKYDFVLVDRRHKKSKNLDINFTIYQYLRIKIGLIFNKIIRMYLPIKFKDTQAGLKGFIKPDNFSKLNFVSKRFFFDLELMIYFTLHKKKIKTIPVNFNVSTDSTIKIFDLFKNIEILRELINVIKK
jgi:glycosyltransferase involved in cell wall biosynthesis